ncbi:MAG TPA: outer membrane protein assembly factor BamA [Pyrinomonadaceae bacterium]|jgi:outer membrane protein insertion porin family|nr:outer membrane protein assembly factor BamA [Pyrinomonadaceae bacterium]
MHSYARVWLALLSAIIAISALAFVKPAYAQQPQQRLVETVDIIGNRRLRKDDILYYVQTRPGDVYNPAQVERDLQAILALGFFDKVETRVTIEDGPRGGVVVTFYVKELPIIRDIQFEGLHSVAESDVLKTFRERRVGVSKEAIYDPVKVRNAIRVLKELLAAKGHPNAVITEEKEQISATSVGITFRVDEGARVRVAEIHFDSKVFKSGTLRGQMKYVKEAGLFSRIREQDILHREKLDYDLHLVDNYMRSKGYLQARHGEPQIEGLGRRRTGFPILPVPFLSSTDEVLRINVPITEGRLYRVGELKIEGNSIFSEQVIKNLIGLKNGDIANGEAISKALYENLKKAYGAQGFIQYTAEIQPTFKDNPQKPDEGIADFLVTIDEGKQFTLRRLEFTGNTFTRDNVLRREVLINEGDIYNQNLFEYSIVRLNQLGYFNPIDKDKDADYRTNEEEALVDVTVKVAEKGRQEISFNGGVSGIGGSFFGLHYSTNNLFGRGEVLSLDLAAGNRQRSFSFSFTEPYIKNRPITAGFSIFAYSQKFFGEGTALSQNLSAQQGLFGSALDFFNTSSENLFTRESLGATVFASAPLSEFYRKRPFTQFSRVGLSYLFSSSSTKDPQVNTGTNTDQFIPVVYRQPNIITSRVTASFVYDARDYKGGIDPTSGKSLSIGLSFAGLLGDVRTYQPTVEFMQFHPVRNKRTDHPQVFGFRLQGGTVGSFAISPKVRNANSLAFVDGVPIYERFFLGDEFSIRGYPPRGISPFVPLDFYLTSRNVVLASNAFGTATVVPGLPQSLANVGLFTGPTGNNVVKLSRVWTRIGGDTQLLGNFEYRIPLIGKAVSAALFADVGSSFNFRTKGEQSYSSEFLADQPFLQTVGFISCSRFGSTGVAALTLSSAVFCNHPGFAVQPVLGSLVARDNRLVTQAELDAAQTGMIDPNTGLPFGFQPVFIRGEAQTNTVARLGESKFGKIGDFHSSIGAELRFQVPILNVPFRLIYAYNPRARQDQFIEGFPFIFNEKKRVFRFSVGRTF